MAARFLCGRFEFDLERPLVMGILNITPDSFSDGGRYDSMDAALAHAYRLIREGAQILDLGAESTRPGAEPVSVADELNRLLPLIEALRDCGVPLSIDTSKSTVMRAALNAGADMINDVYAFRQPGALEAVAAASCGLCAMHMKGEPRTMQARPPEYSDLIGEVSHFLDERVRALQAVNVDPRRIVLDPGFGFGKTTQQNFQLLRQLTDLQRIGYPMLIGLSRKTMIGQVTGRPVNERLSGSVAAALACVARGASIVRVHDVAATVDALQVWQAVEQGV